MRCLALCILSYLAGIFTTAFLISWAFDKRIRAIKAGNKWESRWEETLRRAQEEGYDDH